jgi:hypothetical protein
LAKKRVMWHWIYWTGRFRVLPAKYNVVSFHMAAKVRRLKIGITLTVAISLAIVLLAPSPVVPAIASEVGSGGIPLIAQDFSVVPPSLIEDAAELAAELFWQPRIRILL